MFKGENHFKKLISPVLSCIIPFSMVLHMIWCSLAYQKWLTQHKIVFPFWLTLEVDIGADGVEVVLDHGHALTEADDVVVAR